MSLSKDMKQVKCENFNELSVDCMKCILSKLSLKEKFGVQRVCKMWKHIIEELLMQEENLQFGRGGGHYDVSGAMDKISVMNERYDICFNFGVKFFLLDINRLEPLMPKFQNIKVLNICDCIMDETILLWLLNNCPKLNSLFLKEYAREGDDLIEGGIVIIEKEDSYPYRRMRRFYNRFINIIDWSLVDKILGNKLISLQIDVWHWREENIAKLVAKSPQLRRLKLDLCKKPGQLFDALGKEIRQLEANFLELNLSDLKSFNAGNGKQITHFKTGIFSSEMQTLYNYGLLLKSMVNLKKLQLNISHNSFQVILISIGSLKSVTDLELDIKLYSKNVYNSQFETNLPVNESIKTLTLSGYFFATQLLFVSKIVKNIERFYARFELNCKCPHRRSNGCVPCNQKCIQLLTSFLDLKQITISRPCIKEAFLQALTSLSQLELIEILDSCHFKKEDIVSLLESCDKLIQKKEPKKFYLLLGRKTLVEYKKSCEKLIFNSNLIIRESF